VELGMGWTSKGGFYATARIAGNPEACARAAPRPDRQDVRNRCAKTIPHGVRIGS